MSSFRAIVTPADVHLPESARQAPARARGRAAEWAATPIRRRLDVVRRLRHRLGDDPGSLAATVDLPWRGAGPSDGRAETLTAEVLPLLAACRFLEREAESILKPRRRGLGRRPAWLFGSRLEIRRDPYGVVLVIGPRNYPLFLPGVQALQALAAGNVVLVKPGDGAAAPMRYLARELSAAGLPDDVFQVLPDDVEAAEQALDAGVDKVILTGSGDAGRAVRRRLAETPTPTVMELSGNDSVIVRADADLDLAARGVAFARTLNGGFTCMVPRRVFVATAVAADFERRLERELAARGETDDVVPLAQELSLIPIAGDDEAVRRVAESPHRLSAAVFGAERAARALAERLDVGTVVVNDVIVPTADPRAPFGGRGASGFGTTRGAEGLRELTTPKSVLVRGGLFGFRPHFDPSDADDAALFEAFVRAAHGSTLLGRLQAAWRVLTEGRRRGRRQKSSQARGDDTEPAS